MAWRPGLARLTMLLVCGGLPACQRDGGAAPVPPPPAKPAPLAETSAIFTGTGSCSGRSCHGGLEALTGRDIGQDEFSRWIAHDPHARAYQVLFEERSLRIGKNLGVKNVHEDARCLSCHVTPYAADAKSATAKQEHLFGVGCESCHGRAGAWLGPHTLEGWSNLSDDAKRAKGMTPTRSLAHMASACVGCHVGAPADVKNHIGLPRDVNHDLIAAGHPRLNFELDVFLDNLPPHWNTKEKEVKVVSEKQPRIWAQGHENIWAHGQHATAQAALELLAYRADDKSLTADKKPTVWPEFAEYDCFACHHDLKGEVNWRQRDVKGGRRLGALPWGTWAFSVSRAIGGKDVVAQLAALESSMAQSLPPRDKVHGVAKSAVNAFNEWHTKIGKSIDRTTAKDWLTRLGSDERWTQDPSWDAAMQLSLAAHSLNQLAGDPSVKGALDKLNLSFGKGLDSPQGFEPKQIEELRKTLGGLSR